MQTKDRETTETRAAEPPAPLADLPITERDVRRKRPPALSFLLRMETMRAAARIVSVLALDLLAVAGAIFTALALKDFVHGDLVLSEVYDQTREIVAFVYLVTALLFARSDLYARRSVRPCMTRIVASLFQVTLVALGFAVVNGEQFSSYYIFYGSLAFSILYVTTLRVIFDRLTGIVLRAAGYRRRTMLVGTGEHIEAVAHALGG